MELNIRKAIAKDIDMVAEIYDRILDNEERTGKVYTNWKKDSIPQKMTLWPPLTRERSMWERQRERFWPA